jgi:hypothetical protein
MNFLDGIVDDLKFSVYGTNSELDNPFNFAVDNDAAVAALAGIDAADVNLDGDVAGDGTGPAASDDVTAFVDGWMSRNVLPTQGDLNFDGVTDIADWAILNAADPSAGGAALAAIAGAGVPEPSTVVLAILAGLGLAGTMIRARRVAAGQR